MTPIWQTYLDTAAAAAALLRDPALAAAWDADSALAHYRVGALAGHLAWQIVAVPEMLTAVPPDGAPRALLEHYTGAAWLGAAPDAEINTRLRDLGERVAADGPVALAERADEALARLSVALPGAPPGRLVRLGPSVLRLEDFLTSRLLEITVHADDLAVSVGVEAPPMPAPAVEAVLGLLTRLAVARHGPTAVLRALSRAERAPATIAAI
ncbi:maleylpyruvate isomerase N-terminal domain-containing protein [Frankia sp. AgB32]|uniref:maleylpyruvate isomerase N-terminal domain-containing protein n=1 Tax=Frankia sp. AgB32 TaxID=631119 RepID=UPI00200E63C4|nr:maleylpyruvate isomerase N-terminal domain-containing protein [Frankia sp. AgB32]MCK9897712.1 maleylpyruvate isomerase N-terminal domain-containing protein [Frankia sp. AgB32]